ncbi:MAG: hypothetical protein PARBA_00465 [Parabacteroides sp.]
MNYCVIIFCPNNEDPNNEDPNNKDPKVYNFISKETTNADMDEAIKIFKLGIGIIWMTVVPENSLCIAVERANEILLENKFSELVMNNENYTKLEITKEFLKSVKRI